MTQEAVDLPLHSSRELSTSTPLTVLTPLQAARLRLAAITTLMFRARTLTSIPCAAVSRGVSKPQRLWDREHANWPERVAWATRSRAHQAEADPDFSAI